MAAVTAAMVKELRELTGAGMVDCKNTLVETDGDVKLAIDKLREKGLAAAAKKAGRVASEGVAHVLLSEDGKTGVVLEINSETDFVAKNADFRAYVDAVAKQLLNSDSTDVETFKTEKWTSDPQFTVGEALSQKIAVIGENITIRRFMKMQANPNCFFATYIHGEGKMAVMLELESDNASDLAKSAGRNLCMQIAALYPKYISREEIDAGFIEKEREILRAAALNEGKPEKVVDKMVEGRLTKNLQELCLLDQMYVKNQDINVNQYLKEVSAENGATVTAKRFVSFERGEGIEKKEENFADEVNKVLGK